MPAKHCSYCGRDNAAEARTCSGCGRKLSPVEEADPAGAQPEARSVIFRTFPSTMNAQVVAERLEAAGIPVVVSGDDFGGYNPSLIMGRGVRLLVKDSDRSRAEEALRDIEEQLGAMGGEAGGDTGVPLDTPRRRRRSAYLAKLGLLALGALIGWMSHYALRLHRANYTGTKDDDANGDGRADAWWSYEGGQLVQYWEDQNFDGKPDAWTHYTNGEASSGEEDSNFDGKPDIWYQYINGRVSFQRRDRDFDGKPDAETYFKFGIPTLTVYPATNRLGYWKRDYYTNSAVRQVDLDRNRDGVLDERIFFDAFGVLLRVEPIK